jgi:hypothetical protein
MKKGVQVMTDGIGRIFGGSNYGVGGYMQQKKEDIPQEATAQEVQPNYEETQVEPSKIMDFMANNNYFVNTSNVTEPAELDNETQTRVAGYMENFEMIYGIVSNEFGEENAPTVMDYVMDYLMGMVA